MARDSIDTVNTMIQRAKTASIVLVVSRHGAKCVDLEESSVEDGAQYGTRVGCTEGCVCVMDAHIYQTVGVNWSWGG